MADVKRKKLEVVSGTGGPAGRKKAAGPRCAGTGVKTLRVAADKTVEENSERLARRLLTAALAGDLKSAMLLFSLAELEPEQDGSGKKRHGWSTAQALAAEPEWREDVPEGAVETGTGSSEPEGRGL